MEVEQPGTRPLGNEPPAATTSTTAETISTSFKLEKEECDSAFETWCFLQDLNDIRKFTLQTWEAYNAGRTSFLAASSITSTAFAQLRRTDEEFAQESPFKSTAWTALTDYLRLGYFIRGKAVWLHPAPEKANRPRLPDADINIVELLCPVAYICLQRWSQDFGAMGQASPRSSESTKKQHNDSDEYLNIISKMFKYNIDQIHAISKKPKHTEMLDDFIFGLIDIRSSGITMWMVVACQTYLDIYDLLGENLWQGVHIIREIFADVKLLVTDIDAYKKLSGRDMKDVELSLQDLQDFRRYTIFAEKRVKLLDDKIDVDMPTKHQTKEACIAETLAKRVSHKEACFPATAGEMLTYLVLARYDIGRCLSRHGSFIISMAHLYGAFRAQGILDEEWVDMEFVLARFGTKQSLVSKAGQPFDGDAASRRYYLALGRKMQDIEIPAPGKGRRPQPESVMAPHREVIKARGVECSSRLLQGLLDRHSRFETHDARNKTETLETMLHALVIDTHGASSKKKRKAAPSPKPSSTSIQLLDALRKQWACDEPTVNFDFIRFTLSCARLLHAMANHPGALGRLDAREPQNYHSALVVSLLHCSAEQPAFQQAAGLIRDHIQSEGKVFSQRALERSSNHIPKHLHPPINVHIANRCEEIDPVRMMLDYTTTKYSITEMALAAYHPNIRPELGSELIDRRSRLSGAETDPATLTDYRYEFVAHGSLFPKALMAEAMANAKKDPERYIASRLKVLDIVIGRNINNLGDNPEAALKEIITHVSGFPPVALPCIAHAQAGIVPTGNSRGTQWVFQVPAGYAGQDFPRSISHAEYLDMIVDAVPAYKDMFRQVLKDHSLPMPLSAWRLDQLREPMTQDAIIHIVICAHWRLQEVVATTEGPIPIQVLV